MESQAQDGRGVLEARDVGAGYGEGGILPGGSVGVQEGEMVAVIGPNGAGKSTLLKAMFGLLRVRQGRVLLRGEEVTNFQPDRMVARGLSYVPQTENIFPSLTINENLEMGGFIRRDGLRDRLAQGSELFPA